MTLPSFLGIGTQRSGSTWLHLLLQDHPQVYMPIKRKELHFFDHNYHQGLEWYESFFPDDGLGKYREIGEITPAYMHHPDGAKRIASMKTVQKLIVILRNPVDRAYSAYGHYVRIRNYDKSFEDYLNEYSTAIDYGLYADKIEKFLDYYTRDQICCFIFETAVKDVEGTKAKLSEFLEIDFHAFPDSAGNKKVNETYLPKFKRLNRWATFLRNRLLKANADWVVLLIKKIGFQKVLKAGSKTNLPSISLERKINLYQTVFKDDIEKLEQLLDIDLELWKFHESSPSA